MGVLAISWNINEILKLACEINTSDVHLTVNSAPALRRQGELFSLEEPEQWGEAEGAMVGDKLTAADTDRLLRQMVTEAQYLKFQECGEVDFSYAITNVGRFRVHAFRQQGCTALAIRLIYSGDLSFAELGLPEILAAMCRKTHGLVLVTGPTGSGKSTTLAALIHFINTESRRHIITLEDPVEFVHRHQKSLVNQREVGSDTVSFAVALRAALRADPDVLLIGEMRDLETMATALAAAETGHLVFGTLHTADTVQAIDRMIGAFPPHQQQQIRLQLSNSLQSVVAQMLLSRTDRPGRVAAFEVMLATPAIRNLIREGKTYQMINQLQTGAKFGMQSFDTDLVRIYQEGIISREEALNNISDPALLSEI